MRILLLSQFYPPVIGGEERHVRNLGAALARRGHHVSVGTLWHPGSPETELDGAVRVHRLRGTLQRLSGLHADPERRHAPPFPDPELMLALKRLVAQEEPDIVHAHNWIYASFLPLKGLSGARLVVTFHDYGLVCAKKNFMHLGAQLCSGPAAAKCLPCATGHYGAVKAAVTTLGNWASSFAARRVVDRFIAVSHAVARHNGLTQGHAPYDVIPNFVPDDVGVLGPEDACLRELPGDGFILFVGDLTRLKGIDVLLQAYASLERAPQLVLIGRRVPDTPTKFPPNVQVFSMWPHSAIMHAWRRSLFGVLPSVGPEACATVIMEAMASGKAVVATDIGGMPDIVDHGETGLLVPSGDAHALASAMQRLLEDRALLARLEATGLARIERLKAGAVVTRIEQVYRDVLRPAPGRSVVPAQQSSG
ncbi:glycosyltransferase [Mesorhizobium sp. M2A.F.Ca.ET.037.01.1.1]|uniref:glycosyltransferase family 4 protein n=1 Tax=unclassified Mesorhizobium TaxID=325217 RepID=UPI000F752157|nr:MULTISPECIES: glycosyltransferase family 4 protein [unclassified Mesorhizobium]RUY11292.1 glycosyltransferase [Mesorhizobium sp. M2A.F.Ca.ET.040.01.1.1]RVC70993.1 glycosyltransferase [Mesorhizobium sp. M00.F.Ca.ET.038.03.1.1]RVC80714.1 glycosyltransferase [Mesorhizobium sp. M2A.F.Ca.ET.046.02.1.1]AZO34679.1 glycosyltransferase family 1 protein [Mesorhizobium sp. M2A.F.Ca.ET.046.03.2.1]RUX23464.1 glycosyltransferase [Mesorhizobium sp. M2A.F.Ca.ET.037.01.1.1]